MRELHLFAGIGGGILGGMLLGHRCVGAVEINSYCREVLRARQADGCLPKFPIFDDVRSFDGSAWRDRVDVVCGGFPCQDVSEAGKRRGLDGERSGLWWQMLRVIREVGPRYVFVENVPGLLVRGFDRVLGSLAELGFDAEWVVRSAADVGAPHLRKRLWILAANAARGRCDGTERDVRQGQPNASPRAGDVADADRDGCARPRLHLRPGRPHEEAADPTWQGAGVADTDSPRLAQREGERGDAREEQPAAVRAGWWATEPRFRRVAHGVPDRVERLRGLGNAQVPAVAAAAFAALMREHYAQEAPR